MGVPSYSASSAAKLLQQRVGHAGNRGSLVGVEQKVVGSLPIILGGPRVFQY